ncbi:dihydrofolate reductase [Coemansia sp. RSA 1813]|nr:dihydrofolate reductase [Coemansia sp. RSA 1646]KAJ1771309.1 dihydrofolate reductase [Coemansia sp. RSA 1843]KAJ2088963.1 dihydrofolate reductase [Coemansia sp. RSA 986]KAJ2213230.1 dihydrofolate reductase [Coemansia sp. RSA 487]KAJ2569496.1 dihydrofolate reductase [Coemansia sp. RSA 1813]
MSVTKTLTIIVAAAVKNHGIAIGKDNPWRLPKDLAYFNKVTKTVTGASLRETSKGDDEKLAPTSDVPVMNACILGRKTWEALPKRFQPLKDRYNIVVTSDPHLLSEEEPKFTVTQPSIEAALKFIEDMNASGSAVAKQPAHIDRVFITGGGGIYDEVLKMDDCHIQVLITYVQLHDDDKCNACDAFFPPLDTSKFKLQPHSRLEEVVSFEVPSGMQVEGGLEYEFFLYEKETPSD